MRIYAVRPSDDPDLEGPPRARTWDVVHRASKACVANHDTRSSAHVERRGLEAGAAAYAEASEPLRSALAAHARYSDTRWRIPAVGAEALRLRLIVAGLYGRHDLTPLGEAAVQHGGVVAS